MTRDGAVAWTGVVSGAGQWCSDRGHQSLLVWLPGNMSYLETSFWNDDDHESDDEGIGSDNSADQASDNGHKSPVKQSLSVTKFLRVLKASVRRDPRLGDNVGDQERRPGAVFGVYLSQHLSTTGDNVPNVVRWEPGNNILLSV